MITDEEANNWGSGIWLALIVLLLDQLTKWLLLESFGPTPRLIREITGFLNLVMVWNPGISFGLFAQQEESRTWLLLGITGTITLMLFWWLFTAHRRLPCMALGLVIGGAVGNMIDRVRYGAVVDFIDFHAAGWHWPAFNVADSAIFIGVVLLMIDSMVDERQRKKLESTEPTVEEMEHAE